MKTIRDRGKPKIVWQEKEQNKSVLEVQQQRAWTRKRNREKAQTKKRHSGWREYTSFIILYPAAPFTRLEEKWKEGSLKSEDDAVT